MQLVDPLPAGTTFVSLQQTSGPAVICTTPAVGANGSISCPLGTLASGASSGFTLTARVSASATDGSVVTNTATVSTSTVDPNPANNSSTATTTVSNLADLAVTKNGPASVGAGQNISYTITLANHGASPATSVVLSDALPAGTTFVALAQGSGPVFTCATPAVGSNGTVTCTLANLAAGVNASFTLTASVSGASTNGSTLTNTAVASTASADANNANNSASSTATVSNIVDLSISKTGPATVMAGQDITYLISVSNGGSSPASAVQFTDTLPAGTTFVSLTPNSGPAFTCVTPAVGANGTVTCSIATLAAGATSSVSLVLNTAGLTPGTLSNSVTVSSAGTEANPANNASSAGAIVQPGAPPQFATARQVPTLSSGWLLLLAASLAGVAMAMMRRR